MARRKNHRRSNAGRGYSSTTRPKTQSLPRLSYRQAIPLSFQAHLSGYVRPSRRTYTRPSPRVARVFTSTSPTSNPTGVFHVARTLSPSQHTYRSVSSRDLPRALYCAKRTIRKEVVFASGFGGRNGVRNYKTHSKIKC